MAHQIPEIPKEGAPMCGVSMEAMHLGEGPQVFVVNCVNAWGFEHVFSNWIDVNFGEANTSEIEGKFGKTISLETCIYIYIYLNRRLWCSILATGGR